MQVKKIVSAERLKGNALRLVMDIGDEGGKAETIEYIYRESDQSPFSLQAGILLEQDDAPEITDYELPSDEVILENYSNLVRDQQKQKLLQVNNHLQDDSLTGDEAALLKQYRLEVKQLDQQAGYPTDITWPIYPDIL
ncbi:MAG: hypothetical protein EOO68_04605 [Moraxellaceae bacterium]|nr:MAG: hypothetical protein EOO68_04605 [Moraxellaceae bacterium]